MFFLNDGSQTQLDIAPPSQSEDKIFLPEYDLSSEESLLQNKLENIFRHDAFRPLQKEIILKTMAGKDVLGVLGTGGGKNLSFMPPADFAAVFFRHHN